METRLFRGKERLTKKWVYWDKLGWLSEEFIFDKSNLSLVKYTLVTDLQLISETVGQFLYIKNATYPNGESLYEGDIIKYTDSNWDMAVSMTKLMMAI